MNHKKPYDMFDDILFQKKYSELSASDRNLFENEQEFNEMKKFVTGANFSLAKEETPQPDPAIETRLLNTLSLQKGNKGDVKRQSFADFLFYFFSPQNMGVKLAAASVLVLCALWFKNPQVNVPGNITADTTYQFTDTSANTFDDTIAPPVVLFIH